MAHGGRSSSPYQMRKTGELPNADTVQWNNFIFSRISRCKGILGASPNCSWPVLLQDLNVMHIMVPFVCGVLHFNSIWSYSTWCQDWCKKSFDLNLMRWLHIFAGTPFVKRWSLFAQLLQQHVGCLLGQRPIGLLDTELGYVATWRNKMKTQFLPRNDGYSSPRLGHFRLELKFASSYFRVEIWLF